MEDDRGRWTYLMNPVLAVDTNLIKVYLPFASNILSVRRDRHHFK